MNLVTKIGSFINKLTQISCMVIWGLGVHHCLSVGDYMMASLLAILWKTQNVLAMKVDGLQFYAHEVAATNSEYAIQSASLANVQNKRIGAIERRAAAEEKQANAKARIAKEAETTNIIAVEANMLKQTQIDALKGKTDGAS